MAYERADRLLPAVILAHPIQNVTDRELMARATALADAAEQLLAGQLPSRPV
jgi:hypothetical protein